MKSENGESTDITQEDGVLVIEETLEYGDIEKNLAARNKKQLNFEEYLRTVSPSDSDAADGAFEGDDTAKSTSETSGTATQKQTLRQWFSNLKTDILESSIFRFLFGYEKHGELLSSADAAHIEKHGEPPRGISRFLYLLDDGIISKVMQNTIFRLTSVSAKCYGLLLVAYAIVSCALYIFNIAVASLSPHINLGYFIYGMCAVVMATFLITSDQSLSSTFSQSRLIRAIFVSFLGYRLTDAQAQGGGRVRAHHATLFMLFGALLGAFTVIVPANIVWFVILSFIFLLLSFSSPEFCFNFTILILPFTAFFNYKTLPIAVLTALCGICYIRKLILKKRSFTFEPLDFYVLMFAIIYFLSGITSIGGKPAVSESIMIFILLGGYFLAANLLKSERNLISICRVISFSAFIVSAVGIFEFVTGRAQVAWLDTSLFGTDNGRIVSLFRNPNVLAIYLVLTLPFVIAELAKSARSLALIVRIINLLTVICAIGLTQSRAGYLSLIFCILAMLFSKQKKGVRTIAVVFAVFPYIVLLLPSFILNRFDSIFSTVFDTSVSHRIFMWQGALRMIRDFFFIGIGGGSTAFPSVYPDYATAGAESAIHLHNIFLQCFVETGIFGITVFLLMIFVFVQMNATKVAGVNMPTVRNTRVASFVSVIALLIFGATDYIWYDRRMFFLFFVVMGICTAARRFTKEQSITADAEHNRDLHEFRIDTTVQ